MGVEQTLLTVQDVADRLNVGTSTVYDLVARKKLTCYRIGSRGRGTLRFTEEHVAVYLASTLTAAEVTPSEAASARPAGPFSELDPERLARAWRMR